MVAGGTRGEAEAVRAGRVPTSRESRGLYITANVPPTSILAASSRSLAHVARSTYFPALVIAHSCSRFGRSHLSAMTVTSKMNSVSRQSVLGRLGPGGLLYAANKILAVRVFAM